jgi:hypothetical protein
VKKGKNGECLCFFRLFFAECRVSVKKIKALVRNEVARVRQTEDEMAPVQRTQNPTACEMG